MGFESVKKIAEANFPTRWGAFRIFGFVGQLAAARPCDENAGAGNGKVEELVALVMGDIHSAPPLVRIHSQCLTGDVFGSRRCDCGEQLDLSLQLINAKGFGVLIYLRQEGRGIGLLKKLQAYNLQDEGMDTVDANVHLGHLADERVYDVAAMILQNLQVASVDLMTNNPKKIAALRSLGVDVRERIAIEVPAHADNRTYLKTKAEKMAHLLFGKQ